MRALELCRPVDRQELCELLGRADLDAAGIDTCRAIVAGSGALASVEALIDAKVQQAAEALDRIHPDVAARLESLTALLVDRHA